jgi:filamentous hemagglutinin
MLRDAATAKGNFGIGSGTAAEADVLGRAWVGRGYRIAGDGQTLVSLDGLRQYRPPSFKPNLGRHQANFERRFQGQATGQWQGNGHLNITDR